MLFLLNGVLGKLRNYLGNNKQVRGVKLTLYGTTLCQRPLQRFLPFETITDYNELNEFNDDRFNLNDNRRADKLHIHSSRRPAGKAKEERQCL